MQAQQKQSQNSMEEEAEFQHFEPMQIGRLEEVGINAADIKKLKENNIQTVEGLMSHPKKNL